MTSTKEFDSALVNPITYRADIDGLRAVAIIVVMLYHAFPTTFRGGFIGVDIFFVISGYLISSFIFKGISTFKFSFINFYIRRINRILPALLLILIALFSLSWYFFIPDDLMKISKHVFGSSVFLSNLVYLSEAGYFDDAAELKPLLHLWSLGIEEQFYIIWPLILILGFRFRLNVLILILLCIAISFVLNIYRSGYDANFAFFSLQTRAWELLFGAAIACMAPALRQATTVPKLFVHAASLLGLALLLAGLLLIDKERRFPGWWALLPTIGSGLLIATGSNALVNRYILAFSPLRTIGLISYPLYLWHWVLLSFATIVTAHPLNTTQTLSLIGLSAGLASATYLFIERPIRHSLNTGKTASILLVLMVIVGAIGLYGYRHQGMLGQTKKAVLIDDTGVYPCRSSFLAKQLCVFGNRTSAETILIYGDSHAEHLTAALADTFGERYRIIFAYSSSCYFGEHPSNIYKRPASCDTFVELARTLKDQNIVATIVSQRWHGYGIKNSSEITAAVNDAIKALELNPKKIIVVGSTADVDLHCAKYNYYFEGMKKSQSCHENSASMAINQLFIKTTKNLDKPTNVFFVYPYQALCPNDRCEAIRNGMLLYGDTHHITRAGAALVMPQIKRALDSALTNQ